MTSQLRGKPEKLTEAEQHRKNWITESQQFQVIARQGDPPDSVETWSKRYDEMMKERELHRGSDNQ